MRQVSLPALNRLPCSSSFNPRNKSSPAAAHFSLSASFFPPPLSARDRVFSVPDRRCEQRVLAGPTPFSLHTEFFQAVTFLSFRTSRAYRISPSWDRANPPFVDQEQEIPNFPSFLSKYDRALPFDIRLRFPMSIGPHLPGRIRRISPFRPFPNVDSRLSHGRGYGRVFRPS